MRISDWSSDVCSSDLHRGSSDLRHATAVARQRTARGLSLHTRRRARRSRRRACVGGRRGRAADQRWRNGESLPPVARPAAVSMNGQVTPKRRDYRRSEEHTSELQSLMRISYAVFCLKKKKRPNKYTQQRTE